MSDAIKALEAKLIVEKEENSEYKQSVHVLLEEKSQLSSEVDNLKSKISSMSSSTNDNIVDQLREEISMLEKDALLSMKNLKEKEDDLNEFFGTIPKNSILALIVCNTGTQVCSSVPPSW